MSNGCNSDSYEDIIHLEHHVSKDHPQMSIRNRAAQFAPFAALTGYEDAVEKTSQEHEEAVFNETTPVFLE